MMMWTAGPARSHVIAASPPERGSELAAGEQHERKRLADRDRSPRSIIGHPRHFGPLFPFTDVLARAGARRDGRHVGEVPMVIK
jgi:hypothetical protein